MTDTCRAAVFLGNSTYEVRELRVPSPPPGGAVLKVEAVGLCGSDIAQWHGLVTLPGMRYPIVRWLRLVRFAGGVAGLDIRWRGGGWCMVGVPCRVGDAGALC
jgi:hypothetical protein